MRASGKVFHASERGRTEATRLSILREKNALSQSYLVHPYNSCGEVAEPYHIVAEVTKEA
jgi:hypothetical protein